jgi:sugar/nucleoside kinase (ribokinase family)
MCEAVIIGAGIADILLRPVDETVFEKGSCPVDSIRMSVGGDALNESTVLARLGHRPLFVTKLGTDGVADFILGHCQREGVQVFAARDVQMDTGINAVLVGHDGERSFITNRNGSLRRLSLKDVLPAFETKEFAQVKVVCLASMFVSFDLDLPGMEELFARAKAAGKIVCADSTKRKNGETVADAAETAAGAIVTENMRIARGGAVPQRTAPPLFFK